MGDSYMIVIVFGVGSNFWFVVGIYIIKCNGWELDGRNFFYGGWCYEWILFEYYLFFMKEVNKIFKGEFKSNKLD